MLSKAFGEYLNDFNHIFLLKLQIFLQTLHLKQEKICSVYLDTGYIHHLEHWHEF